MTAPAHPGFVRGSEAYLAAVWYVMKDAKERYEKNHKRIEEGHLDPWSFLRKVRKALGYESTHISYNTMRRELQEFAETFGVEHPGQTVQHLLSAEEFKT